MDNQIYHIVYLTTNLVNQKFYVGVHSTYNLDDGYLGSGKFLKKAIKKHGREKFQRQILHYCLTIKDAYEIEKNIVDLHFIKRKDVYNMVVGANNCCMIGFKHSETTKKIWKSQRNTEEYKQKASLRLKGVKLPKERVLNNRKAVTAQAKKYFFVSPMGEIFITQYNKDRFIEEHNLSKSLLHTFKNKGKVISSGKKINEQVINTIGWEFLDYDLYYNEYKFIPPIPQLLEKYLIISPDGKETHTFELYKFCKDNNLEMSSMYKNINKGKINKPQSKNSKCFMYEVKTYEVVI